MRWCRRGGKREREAAKVGRGEGGGGREKGGEVVTGRWMGSCWWGDAGEVAREGRGSMRWGDRRVRRVGLRWGVQGYRRDVALR